MRLIGRMTHANAPVMINADEQASLRRSHRPAELHAWTSCARVWHLADRSGFHWVSIWDHFYPAMLVPGDAEGTCFEAVSIMTALAAETRHVRVGSLVYCMAYRHPAVLANAMVTVDHVSGGRMELGLGAGWSQLEFDAYGIPFLPIKDRLDQLEEGVQIIRGLFTQPTTTLHRQALHAHRGALRSEAGAAAAADLDRRHGREAAAAHGGEVRRRLERGVHRPGAVRAEEPGADRVVRTARTRAAGGHPHGQPGPGASAATRRRRSASATACTQQFGAAASFLEPGMLIGTPQEVIDRIGAYVQAGAEWIILALRAPFDMEGLQVFIDEVMPAFAP